MKYIAQYIKKLCPGVIIRNSKTTESVYYQMDHNFIIRLSSHIGWYDKGKISVIKSFNTDDFIVMLDTCPFPLIKTRKEVKTLIKSLYEIATLTSLTKEYINVKQKAELEAITEWDKFWSKVCILSPNARYLTNTQKDIIKKYFNRGLRGENMINYVKKIKPVTTTAEHIDEMFTTAFEELKIESK